jgi:IS30 family transposase
MRRCPLSDKFRAILDALPEKPPRSRLEPYSELIDELRRRRRTYREIVDVLAEKCNLRASISTLHDFVRAKEKEAKKAAKALRTTVRQARDENPRTVSPPAGTHKVRDDNPTDDEVRRRIAALKQRPARTPADSTKQFEYNPDEPLRLIPKPGNR